MVTAKDLSQEEHQSLNGYLEQVIEKQSFNKEDLLREIRHMIAIRIDERGK